MAARDPNPLYTAVNAKLAQVVADCPEPPPWSEAWQRLGPESSEEERLAVYQAVRDAGSVPEEAGFYLVSWQIDVLTLEQADEELQDYEDRLEEIRQAHGLGEDEDWDEGQGPPDYQAVLRQQHAAWDALYLANLEEYGEHEMARLLREDRAQFDRRSEAGRRFFHGDVPDEEAEGPAWLDDLLGVVARCIEPDSPMGPLGLRFREEDDFWEIRIYTTPVELVGGAQDGAVVLPGFTLDLLELQAAFEEVVDCVWDALGLNCPEGPYVAIEGTFQGHELYLQVLARPPEDEEPGLKVDTTRRPRRRQ